MKRLGLLLFCILISFNIAAQSQNVNTALIDLSNTKLSVAGPDAVYVDKIAYGDQEISVILKYNGMDGATIYGPYAAEDKLFPESLDLGRAWIALSDTGLLEIYNVGLYGTTYSGKLKYAGGGRLNLASFSELSRDRAFISGRDAR